MANQRTDMRKVRELLRLKFEQNLSNRQASLAIGMGKTAGSEYIAGFRRSGLSMDDLVSLTDDELILAISPHHEEENERYQYLVTRFSYYENELKRTGVTLQLLWQEYRGQTECGFGYSQFCHHFRQWQKSCKVSMHIIHKAGDKMYVDFTGSKVGIVDPTTGALTECEIFVAVLGASQYAYIEAVPSQKVADWVAANENALHYFGGVPRAIVPDCLKSAVIKSDKYEPVLNDTFRDFAQHYDTAIVPARALHPKDKSLAENFVKIAYQRIFAPLRNETFFSIEELNEAFWSQLDKHNNTPFQKKDHSRMELFEELEKSELKALPIARYDLKEFCLLKVQYNHHVYLKEDKHYYSVPFQFSGKRVTVKYGSRVVEIYHNNKRIAFHHRDRKPYGYTTKDEHRPATHQYVAGWNAQRFIDWGDKIAPETGKVVRSVLESKQHPEQGYKSCMGILSLAKKYDKSDFIKACNKALLVNCITYSFIDNTLKNKTYTLSTEEVLTAIPFHNNIRGKENYN
jgi:transposase